MSKVTNLLAALLVVVGFSANADMVTLNGTEVGVYQIDDSVTSFEEFYDHDSTHKWSTALPYAQSNTAVFFIAELNDQLALFGLFDAYTTNKTGSGRATFDFTMNSGNANYLLVDDSGDPRNNNQIAFTWGDQYGDGFILGFDTAFGIDFDTQLTNRSGLGNGVQFLSFDANNQATTIALQSGNFNVAAVPEPAMLALFATALLGFAGFRRAGSKR